MDRRIRARIEALLDRALDLPASERDAWLRKACGGDDGLLESVRALLSAHESPGGLLDRGVAAEAAALVERARPPRPVGPYRILEAVGRGGMSVVYRAERADGQFRQRVALKVLRGELDAEELHTRLTAERQILASLDHPNIARLLDGGMTEDGRPYLVMEYVEGRPLTLHCDRERLPVEARLRLFLEVARAVQHAHARLVVHRDLKPSNILVTTAGRVRLLDFGIAKVLDLGRMELEAGVLPVTRAGMRLFTPEYASPEQLRGEPASVANDVWALGVVLHELLCGARPFEGTGRELEREILETGPVPPSVRVLADPAAAELRGSTPRALSRHLAGDLDRIVGMALRKEPERRYASVDQLAADVEAHLAGHPVRAQPDRALYRLGKLLRRRRVEAAAAALVLLAVLSGAGAALWSAREARLERDRAETAALRSDAVAEYLLDLFRAADPWEVPADRLSARELLKRGEARLEALSDDPLLRARVLLAMGGTYGALGDGRRAASLLAEAVAIRRAELGDEDPKTGEALRAYADLLRREGRFAEAEGLALLALGTGNAEPARRRFAARRDLPDPSSRAATLSVLGFIHTGMGRTDDALADFESELELLRSSGRGDAPEVGHALVNVAAIHRRLGRYDEAERNLQEALDHRRRTLGPDHPLTAVALARLGGLLSGHLGRFEEAAELFEASLEIQGRVLDPDHPSRIEALGGLALVREALGDRAGAEAYLRESLRTHEAGLGADHPTAMAAAEGLARFLARVGRGEEADSVYERTVPARRASLGAAHPSLAGSLAGWGEVLVGLGRADEAEAVLLEALRIREEVFGERHALVGLSLAELAEVHGVRGDRSGQVDLLARAVEILEAFHPPGHPETLALRRRLDRARCPAEDLSCAESR